MNVAIDARMAVYNVGVGRHVRELVSALGRVDAENRYDIIIGTDDDRSFIPSLPNFRIWCTGVSYSDYLRRDPWEQLVLPFRLKQAGIDVYHSPNFTLPVFSHTARVVTVHDLGPLAGWYTTFSGFRVGMLVKLAVKAARMVLTVSQQVKDEIRDVLHVPEERIRVIYNGINPLPFSDLNDNSEALVRMGVRGPYLIFLGSLKKNKNLDRLMDAFVLLPPRLRNSMQLVLAGRTGSYTDDLRHHAESHGITGNVVFTGPVSDRDAVALLQGASLFVLPSVYEGFGMPVLEAMAAGTPVVASSLPCLREVGGDAALYFDPLQPASIAHTIEQGLDADTGTRMRVNGFERIKMFSWDKSARALVSVYSDAFNAASGDPERRRKS